MASSPTTTKSRRLSRDTGFPEPFNGDRNTTLPHPDADLSPNACLTQEDIDPDRALARTRRSFLKKKHRRTLQHGKIKPQDEAMYSVYSLVSSHGDSHGDSDTPKPAAPSLSSVRISKDGTESITSHRDDETPPTSPDVLSHRPKGGILNKWRKDSRK